MEESMTTAANCSVYMQPKNHRGTFALPPPPPQAPPCLSYIVHVESVVSDMNSVTLPVSGAVIADTSGESAGILTETVGLGYNLLIQNKEQVTNKQLLKNFLATPLSLSTCKEQQHTHLGPEQ